MEKYIATIEDIEDRKEFSDTLTIMTSQGAIGETQPLDYTDSIWYRENIEEFKKMNFPEGDISEHFEDIIFDFDGVIYNSVKPMYLSAKYMIEKMAGENINISGLSVEDIANSYHSPFNEYYERFGIKLNDPKKAREFYDYYQSIAYPKAKKELGEPELYPESYEILKKLRDAKQKNSNLKIHLVTAGMESYVSKVMSNLGIADMFDRTYFDASDKEKAITEIVSASGNPDRTIMIGDLPSDIKDARKVTGVSTVAVARGKREAGRLGYYLPNYVISDLTELFKLKSYAKQINHEK